TTGASAPQQLRSELPPEWSALVMRLLDKHPARRPASAREVAQALAAVERSLTAPVAPAGGPDPWADIEVTEPAIGTELPAPGKPNRPRHRWLIATALCGILVLLAAAVVITLRTPKGTPRI